MWIQAGAIGAVTAVGVSAVLLPGGAEEVPTDGPVVAEIFATREGLVGGHTANGHVITERDYFAALPSREGLSTKGGGERTVRVCRSGRCVFLPVWDVGPWNIEDDYWNADRQSWPDLPVGIPEAQAAYQDGYNDGLDQLGRTVRNPSGMDLADGAFWDGLRLTANAWVDVTFLWTGSIGPSVTVDTEGDPLTIRESPSTQAPEVGFAARSARIPVRCQVRGEAIGSTDLWDQLGPGMYVSHHYVATAADWSVPSCDPRSASPSPSPSPQPAPSPQLSPEPSPSPVVIPVGAASPTPGPAPSSP